MPTTATYTFEPGTQRLDPIMGDVEDVNELNVKLADGTYARGVVLGEVTATPGTYAAYAHGNADGTETAKGILRYACTVASGVVTLAGEFGQTQHGVPMIVGGGAFWKVADLTGLDSYAITQLAASLVQGDTSAGILRY